MAIVRTDEVVRARLTPRIAVFTSVQYAVAARALAGASARARTRLGMLIVAEAILVVGCGWVAPLVVFQDSITAAWGYARTETFAQTAFTGVLESVTAECCLAIVNV